MGFLAALGMTGFVTAAEGVANIIDRFVETDEEKKQFDIIKAKIMMEPSIAQIELNKVEAQHRSLFVAGWRPFIGWVCGIGIAWHFMIYDLLVWFQINFYPGTGILPPLTGTDQLLTLVLSLLGLGAFRTFEKITGKTS